MGEQPLVVFDGDDTLWHVEPLYDRARTATALLVQEAGFDSVAWEQLQRTRDLANVERLGLSRERFPTSAVEAYEELARQAGRTFDVAVVDLIRRTAASVFATAAPTAEGAVDVLRQLSESFTLVLLTKGDRGVQEARVEASGLASHFDAIEIVVDKSVDDFKRIMYEFDARPQKSWSIGNSIPSDINPALQLGMSAIWIDAPVWLHERRELLPHEGGGSLYVAPSLKEALAVLLDQHQLA